MLKFDTDALPGETLPRGILPREILPQDAHPLELLSRGDDSRELMLFQLGVVAFLATAAALSLAL